jgi:hypothetical protein
MILADLLAATAHRPYPLPAGGWRYYQEWNEALLRPWRGPLAVLRPLGYLQLAGQ